MARASAQSQQQDHPSDWLFESVLQYITSPYWDLQVTAFIEKNCVVFDDEEENKLAYNQIHQRFIELVDSLLEGFLQDIGVSAMEFYEACRVGAERDPLNKQVFEMIMAVDDFLAFRTMMVKKNIELEMEALRAIQSELSGMAAARLPANATGPASLSPSARGGASVSSSGAASSVAVSGDAGACEERRMLEEALRRSQADAASPRMARAQLQHDEDLKLAIEQSLAAAQQAAQMAESEQLELEAALQLSLELENQRVKQLQAEDQALLDQQRQQQSTRSKMEASQQPQTRAALPALQRKADVASSLDMQAFLQRREQIRQETEQALQRQQELSQKLATVSGARKKEWNPEELLSRKQYHREQRDKILASKTLSREEKANKLLAQADALQASAAQGAGAAKALDHEAQLRISLAQRFKQHILADNDQKQRDMRDKQFASLDGQLQSVEEKRQERRRREQDLLTEASKHQAETGGIHQALQRSLANPDDFSAEF
eukprot:gnl/Hemi2/24116_TR8093_c0_g1_i1.p1 gnl/Hemi2/24116_TR8093_c0_g1~~gnl/Hemi2/24116_TR8093_c0_g1_i1.p1  ORF type:complete len:493 (-),score=200.12 gnl/Hemi2/24116_TR8093_c0_g1_i1:243-1721(-)